MHVITEYRNKSSLNILQNIKHFLHILVKTEKNYYQKQMNTV